MLALQRQTLSHLEDTLDAFWFAVWHPTIYQCWVRILIHEEIALDIPITAKEMSVVHSCPYHRLMRKTASPLSVVNQKPLRILQNAKAVTQLDSCQHTNVNGQSVFHQKWRCGPQGTKIAWFVRPLVEPIGMENGIKIHCWLFLSLDLCRLRRTPAQDGKLRFS